MQMHKFFFALTFLVNIGLKFTRCNLTKFSQCFVRVFSIVLFLLLLLLLLLLSLLFIFSLIAVAIFAIHVVGFASGITVVVVSDVVRISLRIIHELFT